MIEYKEKNIQDISEIEDIYKELLKNKWHFVVINYNKEKNILTKEKSFFKIDDLDRYVKEANADVFYRTIIEREEKANLKDLEIYNKYVEKYKERMSKIVYGEKYIFGSIAVKQEDGSYITTLRGKENFNEYTIVKSVDHDKHEIRVCGKKATLNAPLLDEIFKNTNVKAIVHINHEFDDNLKYLDYAFPGTVRDSLRENNTSFNIRHHGLIYLIDKNGKII